MASAHPQSLERAQWKKKLEKTLNPGIENIEGQT